MLNKTLNFCIVIIFMYLFTLELIGDLRHVTTGSVKPKSSHNAVWNVFIIMAYGSVSVE